MINAPDKHWSVIEPCFTHWFLGDKRHRENDLPAIENVNGDKAWWFQGQLHRENDQPAVENVDGYRAWWFWGKLHRENDQPAVENADGSQSWYKNGLPHRENDLPATVYVNGSREWWFNGKFHREDDKPAIINTEFKLKMWFFNGKKHRLFGPAVQYEYYQNEWWIDGVNITRFRNKYLEARKRRAQKKIYFWIIKILYRPGSESAKRLAEISYQKVISSLRKCSQSILSHLRMTWRQSEQDPRLREKNQDDRVFEVSL